MIWDKIKATCFRSLTIATGYVSLIAGQAMSNLDAIADAVRDPDLNNQIQGIIGHDPKIAAVYAKVFGTLMIVTRLRSIFIRRR